MTSQKVADKLWDLLRFYVSCLKKIRLPASELTSRGGGWDTVAHGMRLSQCLQLRRLCPPVGPGEGMGHGQDAHVQAMVLDAEKQVRSHLCKMLPPLQGPSTLPVTSLLASEPALRLAGDLTYHWVTGTWKSALHQAGGREGGNKSRRKIRRNRKQGRKGLRGQEDGKAVPTELPESTPPIRNLPDHAQ